MDFYVRFRFGGEHDDQENGETQFGIVFMLVSCSCVVSRFRFECFRFSVFE